MYKYLEDWTHEDFEEIRKKRYEKELRQKEIEDLYSEDDEIDFF